MNTIKKVLIIVMLLTPLLSLCQTRRNSLPRWVENPPTSTNKFYAVGVGSSGNADIAERKAQLDAKVKLAEQVEPALISYTSRIDSIVKGNEVMVERVSVVRKKVMANLYDVRETDKANYQKNGTHTTYILLEMPKESIAKSVVNQINQDKHLHSVLSGSKRYKKLLSEMK